MEEKQKPKLKIDHADPDAGAEQFQRLGRGNGWSIPRQKSETKKQDAHPKIWMGVSQKKKSVAAFIYPGNEVKKRISKEYRK